MCCEKEIQTKAFKPAKQHLTKRTLPAKINAGELE